MRNAWLTAKIALLFAVLLVLVLLATMRVFGQVLGQDLVRDLNALRLGEATLVAERLERLLDDRDLDDPAVCALLRESGDEVGAVIVLVDDAGGPLACCGPRPGWKDRRWKHRKTVECQGRTCFVDRRPPFEVYVPVIKDGETVATLAVTPPRIDVASRKGFQRRMLYVGVAAMVGILGISMVVTSPLRRMGRSMDRVAAGDLEHRVRCRGHDDVAQMGSSFNTMAERVQGMVNGQKELAAGFSHELRSPLARMKLSLELLREGGAEERRVRDMEAEVDALDELVAEMLVASRLDLGAAPLDPAPLSMRELAEEAWRRVEVEAGEQGTELQLELGADARVEADRALVIRVLGNLLENAVRHGSGRPVTVSACPVSDRLEITVADRGPGVAEEHLERLFETFYRADPSRSRRTGGSGLGLMIVRRAVEAHGGRVRATARDGGGLAVTFDLAAITAPS